MAEKLLTQDEMKVHFTVEQQAVVNNIVEKRLARDRQERRSTSPQVLSEARVYALASPHSYYGDVIQARLDPHGVLHPDAHDRLKRYAKELAHEMERGTPEGVRAERILREATRESDKRIHERRFNAALKEVRDLVTGGGTTATAASQAAAFVAPAFLIDQWAPFRGAERAFADQCTLLPLPAYGMQVYLPYFATTDAGAQQTENSGVADVDPTTGLQGSPVVTVAGQLALTQQLYDRFAAGGTADAVFAQELQQRLHEKVDTFVLNNVIAGAASVAGATSLTANSLKEVYQDLSKGREQLTDTMGVRLRPTHVFSTYDWYSYVSDIVDANGRPMFQPQFAPGFPIAEGADSNDSPYGGNGASGLPKWSRFTGSVLPGGLLWFTDDNIPATGLNTQVLVSAPQEAVVLLESPEPILRVYPQTYAGNLAVDVQLYEYACCITRHASGTAVITGNAYATSDKN